MILVTATPQNATDAQRARAQRLLNLYRDAGYLPRSSAPKLDETSGNIVLTLDVPRAFEVVEIEVDADGKFRTYTRTDGWTPWYA